MPHDSRRINGPAVTQSLALFMKKPDQEPLYKDGHRQDGRKQEEIRPMYLKAGIVEKANGSAYLETSGTKLICAVYGPRDIPKKHDFSSTGNLVCEISFAPFACKERIKDHQDPLSKEYSSLVIGALQCAVCLESYPKSQIDVFINVLEDNGNTLSHATVAASVALANAGIEMLDLVTACSLVFNDKLACVDPTGLELSHTDIVGSLSLAYLPSLNQISCLLKDGEQDVDESIKSINSCIEACLRIHSVMKECLVRSSKTKDQ